MGLFSFGGSAKTDRTDINTRKETIFNKTSAESTSDKLVIDQAGVDKIVKDLLGGAQGLAAIFSGEQTSGIFNSSVAAQASGDLAANVVGEIAKLRAERVTSSIGRQTGKENVVAEEETTNNTAEAKAGFGI